MLLNAGAAAFHPTNDPYIPAPLSPRIRQACANSRRKRPILDPTSPQKSILSPTLDTNSKSPKNSILSPRVAKAAAISAARRNERKADLTWPPPPPPTEPPPPPFFMPLVMPAPKPAPKHIPFHAWATLSPRHSPRHPTSVSDTGENQKVKQVSDTEKRSAASQQFFLEAAARAVHHTPSKEKFGLDENEIGEQADAAKDLFQETTEDLPAEQEKKSVSHAVEVVKRGTRYFTRMVPVAANEKRAAKKQQKKGGSRRRNTNGQKNSNSSRINSSGQQNKSTKAEVQELPLGPGSGIVRWVNAKKFGFVNDSRYPSCDVFFHFSEVEEAFEDKISPGTRVAYEILHDPWSKGESSRRYKVVDVRPLDQ